MSSIDIPNACTTSANEPVGTTSLEAASCNLSFTDRFANTTDLTVTNRVGLTQDSVAGIQAKGEAVINELGASFGFIIQGDFATGFTITNRNQVGQATDGTIWRYTGSLPFTVPAGTTPSSPTYNQLVETDHNELTNRNAVGAHDAGAVTGAVRSFASVADMTANAGGVAYLVDQPLLVNGENDSVTNYVVVNSAADVDLGGGLWAKSLTNKSEYAAPDLSSLFANQRSIVVAGDSLSFSAFDWPVPTNPLNYAYENNSPGLMSWAHMMRDFAHRSDINFIHADNVPFRVEGGAVVTVNDSTQTDRYFLPFNNRNVRMVGKNKTDVVQFVVPCNKVRSVIRIHCVSTPSTATADAGRVDVSFRTYPYTAAPVFKATIETGGRTDYFELDPFRTDFGDTFIGTYPVLVEFSNWRTTADLDPPAQGIQLMISAFSEILMDFRLTGRGGYTIAQVEAEKETMITNFAPELLFLICGANDRALGVSSADFIADLTTVVNATRAANATSEIIFMTTTHASDAMFQTGVVLNGETIDQWLLAIKTAAINLGCRYFDTFDLTKNIDPAEWRFDNVHPTRYGNKIIFDALVNRFFTSAIAKNRIDLTNPQIDGQFAQGRTDKLGTQNILAGSSTFKFNLASLTYQLQTNIDAQAVIKSVTRVDAFTIKVETNYPLIRELSNHAGEGAPLINITLTKSGQPITIAINIYTKITNTYSVEFFLLNMGVTPPSVLTDANNDGEDYIVSWS